MSPCEEKFCIKEKSSDQLSQNFSGDPYGRRSRSAAGGGCSEADEGKVTSGQGCAQAAAARADYFPGRRTRRVRFSPVCSKTKKSAKSVDLTVFGDPYENRTRVTAVKGRCLNRLTTGPYMRGLKPFYENTSVGRCVELVAAVGFEPTTNRV